MKPERGGVGGEVEGVGYKKKPGELTKRKKEGDRKRSVTSYTACSWSRLVTVGKKTVHEGIERERETGWSTGTREGEC